MVMRSVTTANTPPAVRQLSYLAGASFKRDISEDQRGSIAIAIGQGNNNLQGVVTLFVSASFQQGGASA